MLVKLLTRYLRPSGWLLFGAVVFQGLAMLAMLSLPGLTADIVDNGITKGDTAFIWRRGTVMLAVSFGQVVAAIMATVLAARAAMRAGRDLRQDIFDHVLGLSGGEVASFGAGTLLTRNTNDVQHIQMFALAGATILISAPMLALGGLTFAIVSSPSLSWVIVIAVLVLLASTTLIIVRMVPLFRRMQRRLDRVNGIIREQLAGARVVRAFVREHVEEERFGEANTEVMSLGRRVGLLLVLLPPVITLILNVTIIGVIWFGGFQVDAGEIGVGTLFAYMQYVTIILAGVMMASFMALLIPRAAAAAERITEVLGTRSAKLEPAGGRAVFPDAGALEVRDATFAYPGAEHAVLSGVDFRAAPGETIAIVGATGAGKSTLMALLVRLLDTTAGTVLFGGIDVREADLDALWRMVGFVPQRPFLFSGTIATNLRLGRPEATDADLWRALEIAQADQFVAQLDGQLDATVSQAGLNFSGGQRQRLAIARAIARDPQVLMFDDSFSALDPATESRLRQALLKHRPGVTKLVVAQRISSVVDADLIVMLEPGGRASVGTHEQLVKRSELYREIAASQTARGVQP